MKNRIHGSLYCCFSVEKMIVLHPRPKRGTKKKKRKKANLIYLLNYLNWDLSNDTFVLLRYSMNECQIEPSQRKFASCMFFSNYALFQQAMKTELAFLDGQEEWWKIKMNTTILTQGSRQSFVLRHG